MKTWLSIIAAASLLLVPVATLAAEPGQSSSNQNPPVAQPLVREGDFAIKLAAELNLGKADDEETAVTLLAQAGIAPVNGWIPDYPVTPQIIGQLSEAIAQAATDGSLRMDPGEADQVLNRVAAEMTLPEPAGSAGTETAATAPSDAAAINTYYASEGPPIITYYAPPPDYIYLYDWVPYPVYWYGYWFPGFYICQNFTTTVFVTDSFYHGHGDFHGHGGYPARHYPGTRRAIVSNHFRDPISGGRFVVDPVVRTSTNGVRPSTILRGQGRSFMTVSDLRRGYAVNGARPAMSQAGNTAGFPRGGADRPNVQGQGRMSRSPFVAQNDTRTPRSPFVGQNDTRTPRSPFVGQNDTRTPRSPFVGQNDTRTPRSPFVGQNDTRTPRSPFVAQNDTRTPRSPFVAQNDTRTPRSPSVGQNDTRTPRSPFVGQNDTRTPRSPFVTQNDTRTPRSPFVGQNDTRTPRSPFVRQNDTRTPRSPFVGQNDARTPRTSYMVQNAGRISRPSYMVQNQGRWSGSVMLRGAGMPQSGRFNAPYARNTGGRAAAQGGARR